MIVHMETEKHGELYESPTTEIVELKTDKRILAASLEQYESIPW